MTGHGIIPFSTNPYHIFFLIQSLEYTVYEVAFSNKVRDETVYWFLIHIDRFAHLLDNPIFHDSDPI